MDSDVSPLKLHETPTFFMDEFGYYLSNHSGHKGRLVDALLKVEGIPSMTYWVKDGMVFVFDKLVDLVYAQGADQPGIPLRDLATRLMDQAFVTPTEAVEQWGIVPFPYMQDKKKDGWVIRHRPLNALIPGVFRDEAEVRRVFARLLSGTIQEGDGDFLYRGQPMTLCEPLDMLQLPAFPTLPSLPPMKDLPAMDDRRYLKMDIRHRLVLGNVDYSECFAPVSSDFFAWVKGREAAWKNFIMQASETAVKQVAEVWQKLSPSFLSALVEDGDHAPDDGLKIVHRLRFLYPELSSLPDGTLYAWYESYQVTYFDDHEMDTDADAWAVFREDTFLFYLMGKRVDRQEDDAQIIVEAGKWLGYALLRGDTEEDSCTFAREALDYDRAIWSLTRRLSNIMRFLAEEKPFHAMDMEHHGGTVMTMSRIFDAARLGNACA